MIKKTAIFLIIIMIVIPFSACNKNVSNTSSEVDYDIEYEYEYEYVSGNSNTSNNVSDKVNIDETNSNKTNSNSSSNNSNSSQVNSDYSEITDDSIPEYFREDSKMLKNSFYKLNKEKKLNIAYFGGSVTSGYGSSNPNAKSWRALTTSYLKNQYPDAQINETDASIGGTGSEYGVYRALNDLKLTTKEKPDLVFIEFAINDVYDNTNSRKTVESIIRTIYKYNPYADIVLIFVTDFARKNIQFNSISQQIDIANYYHLPYISIGEMLYNDIVKENSGNEPSSVTDKVWNKYFIDSVHPSDSGYEKYAKYVIDYLDRVFKAKSGVPNSLENSYIPATTLSKLPENPYVADFSGQSIPSGFSLGEDNSISCNQSKKELYFTFTGTEIKLWVWGMQTGGELKVEIDGEEIKTIKLHRDPANHTLFPLASNLENKTHSVRLVLYKSTYGSDLKIQKILISGSDNTNGVSIVS